MSKRGFTDHALVQLTLMRMREFIREPEALFWSMIFPLALAAGLGIAFRNRPPEVLKVAAVTPRLAEALRQEKLLDVMQLPPQLAEQFVRTGKVALVAEPAADGSVVYRYDDTNPEGRQARMLADQAIQRASGRQDPVAGNDQIMREPGIALHRLLDPRPDRNGHHGQFDLGTRIFHRGRPAQETDEAHCGDSHAQALLLAVVPAVADDPAAGGRRSAVGVRSTGCSAFLCGDPSWRWWERACWPRLSFSAGGILLASRVRTIEAASGLMNLTMVPMWILSGVFFSSQRFPDLVQPVIKALPLTALIDALRANMLQGAGFAQMAPQAAVLGAWLVVCFGLALRLFRWR